MSEPSHDVCSFRGGAMAGSGDLVAVWEIKLSDGVHQVEFEHGTTSGKRIIRVDGKVRARRRRRWSTCEMRRGRVR